MQMKRPFTKQEMKVMDSEWEFEHPGGSFAIEFRADAVNSCACTPSEHSPERQPRETSSFAHDTSFAFTAVVCVGFPAQAYWRMNDVESDTPTVYIDWGKYGEYELKMAPNGESMAGGAKGDPENWRKAERLRGLNEPPKKRARDDGCGGCKKGCDGCGRD